MFMNADNGIGLLVEDDSTTQDDSLLAQIDLAQFFGKDGALAQQLAGYELRPSQLEMAEAVKQAILAKSHALAEAPTGTGKSIAYLVPAILSGKTVVVATANKSLQSQLFYKDIPFLRQVLDHPISAVIVKGRSNFVCNYKWEKEAATQQQIALYDREDEQIQFMRTWLQETETGDVDDLPFLLSSDLRPRIVSYPDDCLYNDCRFYHDDCWINHMRDQAAEAQVLITNHHLLLNALELGWAGERLLPPAAIYIIDEAHSLEQTATAVFETTVTDYTVEQLLNRTIFQEYLAEAELDEWRFQNTAAFQEVARLHSASAFRIDDELVEMKQLSRGLNGLAQKLKLNHPYAKGDADDIADALGEMMEKEQAVGGDRAGRSTTKDVDADTDPDAVAEQRRAYDQAIEMLSSTATKLMTVAVNTRSDSVVRYAIRIFDRRHTSLELHAAPINPASYLSQILFHPEEPDQQEEETVQQRSVICTSATLATNGNFTHFKQRCGIDEVGVEKVLPAVFNYPQQALLYQPPLPVYNYRNPDHYYSAIANEIERLLQTSRGRALCLFTSWSGLQQVKERLLAEEQKLIWPLRAQGDAPRDALLAWFKATDYSVLLATRSFWEGVDIPGDDLTMVVLDKMPFPTPNDPLHSARMKVIDERGDNSFADYMLPLMNLALKQGFGRLIRRGGDSGVVAILDERLSSKGYGQQTRKDLPPARFSRLFKDVHKFYQTTLEVQAEFALNVWAWEDAKGTGGVDFAKTHHDLPPTISWRWQLLRLQDGKADVMDGTISPTATAKLATNLATPAVATSDEGELYAAIEGLENLRERIERAGRSPGDFSVELRCHTALFSSPPTDIKTSSLYQRWQSVMCCWQQVTLIQIDGG